VELANICNLHCSYCFRSDENLYSSHAEFFPLDLLRRVIDEARDAANVTRISFTGGEPTLHPEFAETLRIIGNDELVAVHCGINTARAKVVLFIISSTFASIAGALVAPRWGYVEPVVAFSPFVSFQVRVRSLTARDAGLASE